MLGALLSSSQNTAALATPSQPPVQSRALGGLWEKIIPSQPGPVQGHNEHICDQTFITASWIDIGFFNLWLGFFLNVFRCLELLSANSVKQPSKSLNHVRCKLCVSLSCFLIFWGKATQNYYVSMFECCMRADFWERWCSEMHHPMSYRQTWLQFDLHQFDPRHWFHVLYQ